jgi:hypothetical protein
VAQSQRRVQRRLRSLEAKGNPLIFKTLMGLFLHFRIRSKAPKAPPDGIAICS